VNPCSISRLSYRICLCTAFDPFLWYPVHLSSLKQPRFVQSGCSKLAILRPKRQPYPMHACPSMRLKKPTILALSRATRGVPLALVFPKAMTQFILCVIVSMSVKETKENNDSHSLLCNSRRTTGSGVSNSHDPLHLVRNRLHILAQLPHPVVLEVCNVV
jgi:hypothetical protein